MPDCRWHATIAVEPNPMVQLLRDQRSCYLLFKRNRNHEALASLPRDRRGDCCCGVGNVRHAAANTSRLARRASHRSPLAILTNERRRRITPEPVIRPREAPSRWPFRRTRCDIGALPAPHFGGWRRVMVPSPCVRPTISIVTMQRPIPGASRARHSGTGCCAGT